MPEAPECQLISELLFQELRTAKITKWETKVNMVGTKGIQTFRNHLPTSVHSVWAHGKRIIFEFIDSRGLKHYAFQSLRLVGSWHNCALQSGKEKSAVWVVHFINSPDGMTKSDDDQVENPVSTDASALAEDGKSNTKGKLLYCDPRKMGTIDFFETEEELQIAVGKLGIKVMDSDDFTETIFLDLTQKRSRMDITRFLMDQSIISGIGNYIKAEVLYDAGISPHRKIGDLSAAEKQSLYGAIVTFVNKVYEKERALPLKTHGDHRAMIKARGPLLQIYGKKHAKKEKTKDGRDTFWDPSFQM